MQACFFGEQALGISTEDQKAVGSRVVCGVSFLLTRNGSLTEMLGLCLQWTSTRSRVELVECLFTFVALFCDVPRRLSRVNFS